MAAQERQEKKTLVNAPACACARGDVWTATNQTLPQADAEDPPSLQHERPGPQSPEAAITAGPVMRRTEGN